MRFWSDKFVFFAKVDTLKNYSNYTISTLNKEEKPKTARTALCLLAAGIALNDTASDVKNLKCILKERKVWMARNFLRSAALLLAMSCKET